MFNKLTHETWERAKLAARVMGDDDDETRAAIARAEQDPAALLVAGIRAMRMQVEREGERTTGEALERAGIQADGGAK